MAPTPPNLTRRDGGSPVAILAIELVRLVDAIEAEHLHQPAEIATVGES